MADTAEYRLIASHRFGWKRSEILYIIILPIVAVVFTAFIFGGFFLSEPKWWLFPVLGVAGSVLLAWTGSSRKKASALELREEGAFWRLYRGGARGSDSGTSVRWDSVSSVSMTKDEYTEVRELSLNALNASGISDGSLALPLRILAASPELRAELAVKMVQEGVEVSPSASRFLDEAAKAAEGAGAT